MKKTDVEQARLLHEIAQSSQPGFGIGFDIVKLGEYTRSRIAQKGRAKDSVGSTPPGGVGKEPKG